MRNKMMHPFLSFFRFITFARLFSNIFLVKSSNDFEKFLSLARHQRNIAKSALDFHKAHHYYEAAIHQHTDKDGDVHGNKELGMALFEYSQFMLNETYLSTLSRSRGHGNHRSIITSQSHIINNNNHHDHPQSHLPHLPHHAVTGSASGVNASYNFHILLQSATMGHPTAQAYLAAAYASGIYLTLTPMDATSSILLQYMSALSGSVEGNMAMGYRYLYGLGVPESCEMALKHYEFSANQVVHNIEERGYTLFVDHTHLSDTSGTASTQRGVAGGGTQIRREFDPEMMDYYTRLAEEGDLGAAVAISSVYSTGSRLIAQDMDRALKYLRIAAAGHLPSARGQLGYYMALQFGSNMTKVIAAMNKNKSVNKNGLDDKKDTNINDISSSNNNNNQKSSSRQQQSTEYTFNTTLIEIMKSHLQCAVNRGDAAALVGLGYCHMRGLGFRRNLTLAVEYFSKANGKHVDAPWHLANMLMGQSAHDNIFFSSTATGVTGMTGSSGVSGGAVGNNVYSQQISPTGPPITTTTAAGSTGTAGTTATTPTTLPSQLQRDRNLRASLVSEKDQTIAIDVAAAVKLYTQAATQGHSLAIHRLSHMMAAGIGIQRSCPSAVNGFKQVSERGEAVTVLNEAHNLIEKSGAYDRALMLFARVASYGVESAQHNTAYVLNKKYCPGVFKPLQLSPLSHLKSTTNGGDENRLSYSIETPFFPSSTSTTTTATATTGTSDKSKNSPSSTPTQSSLSSSLSNSQSSAALTRTQECELRALYMHTLSARQGNAESYLRVGDSYYYGHGGLSVNKKEAASFYQLAAEMRHTHAIFNLGLMHEIGDGVVQDFHLAKRYYDQAAQYDINAQSPRSVALFVLDSHRSLTQWLGPEIMSEALFTIRQVVETVVSTIVDTKSKINYFLLYGRIPTTVVNSDGDDNKDDDGDDSGGSSSDADGDENVDIKETIKGEIDTDNDPYIRETDTDTAAGTETERLSKLTPETKTTTSISSSTTQKATKPTATSTSTTTAKTTTIIGVINNIILEILYQIYEVLEFFYQLYKEIQYQFWSYCNFLHDEWTSKYEKYLSPNHFFSSKNFSSIEKSISTLHNASLDCVYLVMKNIQQNTDSLWLNAGLLAFVVCFRAVVKKLREARRRRIQTQEELRTLRLLQELQERVVQQQLLQQAQQ